VTREVGVSAKDVDKAAVQEAATEVS